MCCQVEIVTHTNIVSAHDDVKKNNFFDEKFAFDNVHLQINFSKTFQYHSHMFDMSFANFVVNKNVVQITLYEIVDVISQHVVHVMLIIDKIVDQFEKQNFVFVEIQKCNERNEIFAI